MNSNIIALNHDSEALATHVEWELLPPASELRPLPSDELHRLMGFDQPVMIFVSPPCAAFHSSTRRGDA